MRRLVRRFGRSRANTSVTQNASWTPTENAAPRAASRTLPGVRARDTARRGAHDHDRDDGHDDARAAASAGGCSRGRTPVRSGTGAALSTPAASRIGSPSSSEDGPLGGVRGSRPEPVRASTASAMEPRSSAATSSRWSALDSLECRRHVAVGQRCVRRCRHCPSLLDLIRQSVDRPAASRDQSARSASASSARLSGLVV